VGILVVGSVALDSVATPFGQVEDALGGSGTYFSVSSSYYTNVDLVAVVGEDFPQKHIDLLKSKEINLSGLQTLKGDTFRWKGRYEYDLNEAHTLDTRLNVFQQFAPQLSPQHMDADYLFLANIDPELQLQVLQQVRRPKLVACDTMNFWIEGKLEALKKTISCIDILMINEGEARQLAQEVNLVKAARKILQMGPKRLVVKRGEYGVLMFSEHATFAAPAYPLEDVYDPTGAGDTFAGGFMGYLASVDNLTEETLRKAIVYGTVMASFTVEKFSLERLQELTWKEIEQRYQHIQALTDF